MEITVYTRKNCKLCQEAISKIKNLNIQFDFDLILIDIDNLGKAKGEYLDKIPLIYINGQEVFRYHLDDGKLLQILMNKPLNPSTRIIEKRYSRIAPFYDLSEFIVEEIYFKKWREKILGNLKGVKILEVGAGTGKNFPYYPADKEVTAIDISLPMLRRAENRIRSSKAVINLAIMDAENLALPDNSFDAIITTYVFCSVPDPVRGLKELKRVCRPDGKIYFLEHVLSTKLFMKTFMNWLNPLTVSLFGFNINRRTVDNIKKAGLTIIEEKNLRSDIFKFIIAKP